MFRATIVDWMMSGGAIVMPDNAPIKQKTTGFEIIASGRTAMPMKISASANCRARGRCHGRLP